MIYIGSFSLQHKDNNLSSGYVHIYDDEADSEVVHTFEISGHVDREVLLAAYNSGATTLFNRD